MFLGLAINGVTEMRNDRVQIKVIVITALVVWLLSLAVFGVLALKVGTAALILLFLYGLWNLVIFSVSYLAVSRKVSNVMKQVDYCI